jgi:hypothetical protein
MLSIHIYKREGPQELTPPPLKLPGRMLEIIRAKVALYYRSEVDIQYSRVAGVGCALGPLQVGRARANGQVVLDFRSRACDATG